jgi:hypothetical protein
MREASRRPTISRGFLAKKNSSFHAGWLQPRDDDAYRVVAEDAYSLGKGQRVSKMSFRFRKRISLGKFLASTLANPVHLSPSASRE